MNSYLCTHDASSYQDHMALWTDKLGPWAPDEIFDAHLHLGPIDAVGSIAPSRLKEPLLTFTSFTWEQAVAWYERLYKGKTVVGSAVFGFPLREVALEAANSYIIKLMRTNSSLKGFLLSDPHDTERTIRNFDAALQSGVRFVGVKPYFDLLGKSNYETRMAEFIPRDLLAFMNRERLVMMLHSAGLGMSDPDNQLFVKKIVTDFPGITVILAHMGRYLQVEQFFRFLDSDVMTHPRIFLEMSSASQTEVYLRTLQHQELWGRLLFGSDLPYGLITGVEHWSPETGPVFLTRDHYPWSSSDWERRFADRRTTLTYNTYHTIKAFSDALGSLDISSQDQERIKRNVFLDNARRLFSASG